MDMVEIWVHNYWYLVPFRSSNKIFIVIGHDDDVKGTNSQFTFQGIFRIYVEYLFIVYDLLHDFQIYLGHW